MQAYSKPLYNSIRNYKVELVRGSSASSGAKMKQRLSFERWPSSARRPGGGRRRLVSAVPEKTRYPGALEDTQRFFPQPFIPYSYTHRPRGRLLC